MLSTPAALLFWSFAITLSISLAVIGASNIRKVYNLFKNDINRDQLNKTSREFKRALNNGFMNYQNKIVH
jgi:hypothetical protein